MYKKVLTPTLLATALLALTACQASNMPLAGKAIDDLNGKTLAAQSRLSTAAADAIAQGKTVEALNLYERLYNESTSGINIFNPSSEKSAATALNYAQLLRKTGKAERALAVLAPYAEHRAGKTNFRAAPAVMNEYAAINIELGQFARAEQVLNHVLEDASAKSQHADAYNLLGVAFDAQGRHKEAEQTFRQALSLWEGDKTSVLNNLAVCLASQGLFDESLLALRQALILAPNKSEVAHNIQLISALRKSVLPKPVATISN